ncbi:MAG: GatB/YqeY domain-containing protein [Bacteroidetes bacterium]|jgi:uncharacterized protein YqeY|nr:GatB/YqeY domain-containing protein [Bacteroidota bacterium]
MSISTQINDDLKTAMKAKDKDSLEALRSVKSALHLAKTEKGQDYQLTDEEELKVLQKLHKQRKDAADVYKSQNRDDLYIKEMTEAQVIERYLPEPMSEEELTRQLEGIITRVGAGSPQEMGKVMGVATKELAGKADGKTISSKVKELLNR